ncbi:hypothetical protein VNO77_43064 [Canavalia gladiata]|uniref:Uncharacterized protein n=1 Tax=Canavalia gladiata TaxID=3824 RepID=A0AAN9PP43_CANGL
MPLIYSNADTLKRRKERRGNSACVVQLRYWYVTLFAVALYMLCMYFFIEFAIVFRVPKITIKIIAMVRHII